ncbi:Uncharacterised protein [Listeria grayi]|nr:Crp/Fnr family transcriptional regulator [Listeria grayi]EUJ27620.1 regulatory cyclic nucleotide-binding protein [Listeria grayi FSL F6-1183]MBC1921090.1 Crp/Fnr family transcriptional regulator [Listeria grayi]VEI35114.1 Uncharacterised protein [Listeria grayi]
MKKTLMTNKPLAKQEYYQINKNQAFFHKGSFYILSGIIVCLYKEQFIAAYQAGDTFFMDEDIIPNLTFVAKRDTHLIASEAYMIEEKRNQLIHQFFNQLSSRLVNYSYRTEERITALFFTLGCQIGEVKNNSCTIPSIFTQKELASFTNVTREYYNALYKKWKDEAVITYSKKNWILNNWTSWVARHQM